MVFCLQKVNVSLQMSFCRSSVYRRRFEGINSCSFQRPLYREDCLKDFCLQESFCRPFVYRSLFVDSLSIKGILQVLCLQKTFWRASMQEIPFQGLLFFEDLFDPLFIKDLLQVLYLKKTSIYRRPFSKRYFTDRRPFVETKVSSSVNRSPFESLLCIKVFWKVFCIQKTVRRSSLHRIFF